MEVENLNLDDFDINEFEPPTFKIDDTFTKLEDTIDYISDDENESYSDEEDDDELEINIENDEEVDFDENFDNVIYSYPFYSKDGVDYEYRITINEEELLLEQVKCDDNKVDFDESIQVFAEIYRGTLDESFEFITKNVDLRDKKSYLLEGIIDYNFDEHKNDVNSLKIKIEQNKVSVLYELYKEIIDSVYE
jgi:hypothetical protein